MTISQKQICRLNYPQHTNRSGSRFKVFVFIGLVMAVSFTIAYYATYQVLPKLLFKPQWTEVPNSTSSNRVGNASTSQVVPKPLFKTKKPWTDVPWNDTDFRLGENELIILRWTAYWRTYSGPRVLTSKKCPYLKPSRVSGEVFDIPCRITYDRRYMRMSDALVFYSADLTREELPEERSKDQIWVYMEQEAPSLQTADLHDYPRVFNWTLTYRRDSDVYYPYGYLAPISTDTSGPHHIGKPDSSLGKRPNLVAWIVSHCDTESKREYLVNELQNHIPVSIYGRCGHAQDCPTNSSDCYAHVAKTHKFYLSFENALCKDYITEKFFHALQTNLVPVVYGGTSLGDYTVVAPPGSYIDARNFTSAKHLADYLVHLDRNEEEYMKYFEWKSKYKIIHSQGWCDLCQNLFEHLQLAPESSSVPSEKKRNYKWYKDLWTWWNYVSYDPRLEQVELSVASRLSVNSKLGAPACQPPIKNLTGITGNFDMKFDWK